jgi:hypothetical protein
VKTPGAAGSFLRGTATPPVGIVLSIAGLALEVFNFRCHQRTRDVVSLVLYSVLENLGYRQLNDLWGRRRGIGNRAARRR